MRASIALAERGVSVADCVELTKPRITLMVVLTTAVGVLVAYPVAPARVSPLLVLAALAGTWLLAAGASALNMWVEREADARMPRTAGRPLPSGRVQPALALSLRLLLGVVGGAILAAAVNLLTAALGGLTLASYVWVYTPLKRSTEWSTLIGAVPGAIPPMMGWTAVAGDLSGPAWALFGILFFWQLPHFFAIAWMYRDQYAEGQFQVLSVVDPNGSRTARQMMVFTVLLVASSCIPTLLGITGPVYLVGALLLGMAFLWCSASFTRRRTFEAARQTMLFSVAYLPAVLALLVGDRLLL